MPLQKRNVTDLPPANNEIWLGVYATIVPLPRCFRGYILMKNEVLVLGTLGSNFGTKKKPLSTAIDGLVFYNSVTFII
jgi:hypothetical protein